MADDIIDTWHHCVLNNLEVKEVNNKISLGGRLFPKDLETSFPVKTPKSNQQDGSQKFYTVGEIFFFVENHSLSHPSYVQKSTEQKIGYIRRPDRKAILSRLAIGAARPMLRSSRSTIEESPVDSPAKKLKVSKTNFEGEEEKPRVKTYSRKRPLPSSRSSPKKQIAVNQGHSLAASTNHMFNEVSTLQTELQAQQRIVGSMTAFLRDFLGLTPAQLQILQSDQYNPSDLKQIATSVQSQCSCSCKHIKSQNPPLNSYQEGGENPVKFCYIAEKHPCRGWEIVKKELAAVLNGSDSGHEDISMNDHHRAALETCLSKTATPLKHALSVLISQMREFNKSPNAFEEVDQFCQKIVKDCLLNAVDSFRDAFGSLFQTLKGSADGDTVEKWVSISEAELKKLLLSLVKSLQTLRDIPPNNTRNLPSTLFHFPEPVFSMALNPAKVTHSVVLEMYIKIGLAELRRIIVSSVDSSENSCAYEGHCSDSETAPHTTSLVFSDIKQEQGVCEPFPTHSLGSPVKSEVVDRVVSSTSEDIFDSKDAASHHSAPELDKLFTEMNGKARSDIFKNTTCQARRSSESDSCHYSMFKASLGNTMVSSFKKQIQEKIQAGSNYFAWN